MPEEGKPKRSLNSFMLYSQTRRNKGCCRGMTPPAAAKKLGKDWNQLTPQRKLFWKNKAAAAAAAAAPAEKKKPAKKTAASKAPKKAAAPAPKKPAKKKAAAKNTVTGTAAAKNTPDELTQILKDGKRVYKKGFEGGVRKMRKTSQDGHPIYKRKDEHPKPFVVVGRGGKTSYQQYKDMEAAQKSFKKTAAAPPAPKANKKAAGKKPEAPKTAARKPMKRKDYLALVMAEEGLTRKQALDSWNEAKHASTSGFKTKQTKTKQTPAKQTPAKQNTKKKVNIRKQYTPKRRPDASNAGPGEVKALEDVPLKKLHAAFAARYAQSWKIPAYVRFANDPTAFKFLVRYIAEKRNLVIHLTKANHRLPAEGREWSDGSTPTRIADMAYQLFDRSERTQVITDMNEAFEALEQD